jgi:hypothetical protein
MGRLTAVFLLTFLAFSSAPFQVFAVTSTNYELDQENNFISTHHSVSSTNYELEGSLEPIAGKTTSSGYILESGSAFAGYCGDGFIDPGEDCDHGNYGDALGGAVCTDVGFDTGSLACATDCTFNTSACSLIGGGGGDTDENDGPAPGAHPDAPGKPEFIGLPEANAEGEVVIPFTYREEFPVSGYIRPGDTVLINGEEAGVHYYPNRVWRISLPLQMGENTFRIRLKNDAGEGGEVMLVVYRRIRGDTNGDGRVNDVDLSRFTRRWRTADPVADFNSDMMVDDYDLSMLSAHWTN